MLLSGMSSSHYVPPSVHRVRGIPCIDRTGSTVSVATPAQPEKRLRVRDIRNRLAPFSPNKKNAGGPWLPLDRRLRGGPDQIVGVDRDDPAVLQLDPPIRQHPDVRVMGDHDDG